MARSAAAAATACRAALRSRSDCVQGQCKNGVCTSRFNTIADGYETGAD